MRVLNCVPGLNEVFGGPSRSVPALCDCLARRLSWLGLFTQAIPGLRSPMVLPRDPTVHLFTVPAQFHPRVRMTTSSGKRRLLGAVLAEHRVQLVHDHGVWQAFNHAVATETARTGIPRIVSPRGMLMKYSFLRSPLRKHVVWHAFQKTDLARADALVATSTLEMEELRSLGVQHPIALIENSVDVPDRAELSRKPSDRRRAVFLSRLHPKKDLGGLIRAWRRVNPRDWSLTIAGPDELGYTAQLKALTAELGLSGAVDFPGPVPESAKHEFLMKADLVVLPTQSENFGIVVAEALAREIPVIATLGAPWSLLGERHCGWWVENTVDGLSAALDDAARRSAAELREMGCRGRALVEERFSAVAVGAKVFALYSWLLHAGEKPAFVS